mmetsp:Transcript_23899/g.26520  ORF Transcript_23899/g.26520 Transcript_23899/m.26520 type:complete len:161 (+) Transcript_23899:396-878(+)
MGVSYAPTLPGDTWLGSFVAWAANTAAYWSITQWLVAPADYWRNPKNPEGYLKHSFLAEANNEAKFDQGRKDKWLALKFARFVKWDRDTTIIPRESSWWGMYTEDYNIISRHDTELYKKDLIGLRTLEEQGRADFVITPGDHMHVSRKNIYNICKDPFSK